MTSGIRSAGVSLLPVERCTHSVGSTDSVSEFYEIFRWNRSSIGTTNSCQLLLCLENCCCLEYHMKVQILRFLHKYHLEIRANFNRRICWISANESKLALPIVALPLSAVFGDYEFQCHAVQLLFPMRWLCAATLPVLLPAWNEFSFQKLATSDYLTLIFTFATLRVAFKSVSFCSTSSTNCECSAE